MMTRTDANGRCLFPLTSLQIGDLQSYLSHLRLFLASESDRFYILVDNRPWLEDLGPRSAHLWQLMVTKSRLSPFANTKARRETKKNKEMDDLNPSSTSGTNKHEKFKKWFSLIDAATLSQKRVLLPVKKLRTTLLLNSELHRTLYGFIIFEVTWSNVRGINYLNELQSDTSLAVEAKIMRRWEFDSIAQAASNLSSWFCGIHYEELLLRDYLDSATGEVYYDAEKDFLSHVPVDQDDEKSVCKNNINEEDIKLNVCAPCVKNYMDLPHSPPPLMGPYKKRKVSDTFHQGIEVSPYSEETHSDFVVLQEHFETIYASEVEASEYRDVLILLRFNDRDLPFKLREIIMSDLRLLRLLEYGLPSWVIFLQSYPGFCHLYRPWMCPLARALYVLISVITVLIGFYDLYKNVPVLKATAYRLCGPLMNWIDTWEMVSRIKYLGTMLFLHNAKKALQWLFMMSRTIRSFLSIIAEPITGPLFQLSEYLLPLWNMCIDGVEGLLSVIWIIVGSSLSLLVDLIEMILHPIWLILSFVWNIATSVFWILGEILYAPIRLAVAFFTLVVSTINCLSGFIGDLWRSLSIVFQFASSEEATIITETSLWRSLWNDLFSQVFRAVRSILNGFVAFFTACNRHRLSIYNHLMEFMRRLCGRNLHPVDAVKNASRCTSRSPTLGLQIEARRQGPEAKHNHFSKMN